MVIWRRRVRAVKAQQKAAALGGTPDNGSTDDVELGLFSFWKPSSRFDVAGAPEKGGFGRSKPAVVLSEADAHKLRSMQRGTPAQREAERQYRTGQHPSPAQLLHHLRRVDSF
ncbi:g10523 [Coccomyxa elongata]